MLLVAAERFCYLLEVTAKTACSQNQPCQPDMAEQPCNKGWSGQQKANSRKQPGNQCSLLLLQAETDSGGQNTGVEAAGSGGNLLMFAQPKGNSAAAAEQTQQQRQLCSAGKRSADGLTCNNVLLSFSLFSFVSRYDSC